MTRTYGLLGTPLAVTLAASMLAFAPGCTRTVAVEEPAPKGPVPPAPGGTCDPPGTLTCAAMNVVLYCSASPGGGTVGTYADVFQCPETQDCAEELGDTSVTCGIAAASSNVAYAYSGKPCAVEGGNACSFDRSAVLVCSGGTWIPSQACGVGIQACTTTAPGTSGQTWMCPWSSAPGGCILCGGS